MKNKREIIAQQGNDRFLIDLGGDMGQILDVGSKELFPPFYIILLLLADIGRTIREGLIWKLEQRLGM